MLKTLLIGDYMTYTSKSNNVIFAKIASAEIKKIKNRSFWEEGFYSFINN